MAGFCEHDNEHSGSIIDHLSDYQVLRKDTSLLHTVSIKYRGGGLKKSKTPVLL
jgi:hypothetical protein